MPLLPELHIQSEMVPTRVDLQISMPRPCCRFFSPSKICDPDGCSFSCPGMLEWWLEVPLMAPPFSSTIKGLLLEVSDRTEIHRATFTDI